MCRTKGCPFPASGGLCASCQRRIERPEIFAMTDGISEPNPSDYESRRLHHARKKPRQKTTPVAENVLYSLVDKIMKPVRVG